jgi:SAM-dependent methyltransferase
MSARQPQPAKSPGANYDREVVDGFGEEWTRFNQGGLDETEAAALFERYFAIFPWDRLPAAAAGFDAGCGSGRWARFVAPRVGSLHCVDASEGALQVASANLARFDNCEFHLATVDSMPLDDGSLDFGYSLGVLHHIPDTASALRACVRKLKPGAPFLVYLYYAFDNRPAWFRAIWKMSDYGRSVLSRSPFRVRSLVCDALALGAYWPLARGARALEMMGANVDNVPLSAYRGQSFYVMRTDALDRFGTRLEQRFSREEIGRMMAAAGLTDVTFHAGPPWWVAVGIKGAGPQR